VSTVSYDTVVIGAGLSGLTDAILLAEWGRRVLVLEQHRIPGGYLQQFERKRTKFDVGFHWIGSTLPGRPLHRLLTHLQVFDRLRLQPFPPDNAIEFRSGPNRFALPTRFDRFVEKALLTWPHERAAVERFAREVEETCALFKWFDLRKDKEYGDTRMLKISRRSLAEQTAEYVSDPWLAEAIAIQASNIGLTADRIPWPKSALVFRSNFDETCRIEGGGGALVDALVERGRELGVEYRFQCGADALECEGRHVRAVRTATGDRIEAELFMAACHPKTALRLLPAGAIHPAHVQRVLDLKDSPGALQVFLRLRRPVESLGTGCMVLQGGPPLGPMLVTLPEPTRLEAMAYVDQEPFAAWRDLPVMQRGPEYEQRKRQYADRMIARIAEIAPELPVAIDDRYASTPLTDEWYTRNEHGAVFGISHDISQQGLDRPMPRMRMRNLWFTGHSIDMPGILGVIVNSFVTCEALRSDGWLFSSAAG
jgi:phytoene dehydrogenase-like protein